MDPVLMFDRKKLNIGLNAVGFILIVGRLKDYYGFLRKNQTSIDLNFKLTLVSLSFLGSREYN